MLARPRRLPLLPPRDFTGAFGRRLQRFRPTRDPPHVIGGARAAPAKRGIAHPSRLASSFSQSGLKFSANRAPRGPRNVGRHSGTDGSALPGLRPAVRRQGKSPAISGGNCVQQADGHLDIVALTPKNHPCRLADGSGDLPTGYSQRLVRRLSRPNRLGLFPRIDRSSDWPHTSRANADARPPIGSSLLPLFASSAPWELNLFAPQMARMGTDKAGWNHTTSVPICVIRG